MTKDKTKKVKDWYWACDCRAWRGNIALRRCSLACRGLLAELNMWMQDGSPERGYLLTESGEVPDARWIAETVAAPEDQVAECLESLEARGVLKKVDGVYHSPRMLRFEGRRTKLSENASKRWEKSMPLQSKLESNLDTKKECNLDSHIGMDLDLGVDLDSDGSGVDAPEPEARPSATELTRAELLQMQAQQLLREASEGLPAESTRTEQVSAGLGHPESITEQPREPEDGDKECHSEVLEGELVEDDALAIQVGHQVGIQKGLQVGLQVGPATEAKISTKLARHPMPDPFGMRSDTLLSVSGVELSPHNSSNMRSVAGYPEPPPQPQRFLRAFGVWDGRGTPGPWAQLAIRAWNEGHGGKLLTEPDPSPQTRHRDIELHRLMVDLDLMPEDLGLVALGLSKSAWHRGENETGFVADLSWATAGKNRSKASKHLELGRRYASGQWVPEEEKAIREAQERVRRLHRLEEMAAKERRKARGEDVD